MYKEKFVEAFNDGFDILITPKIIEEVSYLEQNNNIASQIAIEKNFNTNEHKVALVYFNDNEFFENSKISSTKLKNTTITQVKIFKNKEFIEESYYFDNNSQIENSYDELTEIRNEIKKTFNLWCPCNQKTLEDCLDCFDDDHATILNGIKLDNAKKLSSLITYNNYYDNNYENSLFKYKKRITKLCEIYQIILVPDDLPKLEKIFNIIEPILMCCDKIKLSFGTKHSKTKIKELNLIIHPIINEYRHEIINLSTNCLVHGELLDVFSANQLKSWQPEKTENPWSSDINLEPYKGRLKGYIKIKILRDDDIKTEILSCYGIV